VRTRPLDQGLTARARCPSVQHRRAGRATPRVAQRRPLAVASEAGVATSNSGDVNTRVAQAAAWIGAWRAKQSMGPIGKLKAYLFTPDGKLNTKNLASAGASTALSYGFVSNVNAFTLLMIAWYSFVTSTGMSPMAPGQWPKYLALYATLYATVGNLLRPARIALAATLAPVFEKVVTFFQTKFSLARPWAFAATVFTVNVCGTCSYMGLGVLTMSALLGKPLFG